MSAPSTEPISGLAKIYIGDPLRWGQVEKHAWGGEHPFPRVDDRRVTGTSDEERRPWVPAWVTDAGCSTLPALRALTLTPRMSYRNHWPSACANESELLSLYDPDTPIYWDIVSGGWTPDRPAGYGNTTWLRAFSLTATTPAVAQIRTTYEWHAEPGLVWLCWRWAPTGALATRPYVALTVGADDDGVGGMTITLPCEGQGSTGSKAARPFVTTVRTAGGDDELLAELDQASRSGRAADSTPYLETVYLRSIEPGLYLLTIGGSDVEVPILDSNLRMESERISVSFVDCLGAFTIMPITYPASGTASKLRPGAWPLWANADDGELVVRSYTPAGGTIDAVLVEASMESTDPADPPTTQPVLTLETTDETRTPVVYCVTEVHPPTLLAGVETMTDLSQWFEEVRIHESRDGRSSSATLVPALGRDWDAAGIAENAWAEITVGHMWPGLTAEQDLALAQRVLCGWTEITDRARDGSVREGDPQAAVQVWSWPRRWQGSDGPRKWMNRWAGISWADWLLEDAVRTILEGSGVPAALITFTLPHSGMLASLRVPCARAWERRLAYSSTDGIMKALDEIAASCGCRWRITRDGEVDIYMPTQWSGTPDHVLDENPTDPIDLVEAIRAQADPNGRRNVVQHIGTDRWGNAVVGIVSDSASLFDAASENYIGDDWWSCREDSSIHDPELTALAEMERRMRFRRTVTWTWAGHPAIKPGDTVQVSVTGLGLPTGIVLEVLQKDSTLRRSEMSYSETVMAGVVGAVEES